MDEKYSHRQTGYVIYYSCFFVFVVCISIAYITNPFWVGYLSGFLVCTILSFFFSLNISVSDKVIQCSFQWNVIQRTILLSDVQQVEIVRNPWYWGWGIRYTPRGWLWNVSGFDAVELTYDNGRHFRIGTDEPTELCAAIQNAIAEI